MSREYTRRTVLRTSAAVGSLTAMGALAGCLGDDCGDESGGTEPVAPNTSFEYKYDEPAGELTVRVRSGDTFNSDSISFEGEGLGSDEGTSWTDADNDVGGTPSDISSGAAVTLDDIQNNEFLLQVTWMSKEGCTCSVISVYEGPHRDFSSSSFDTDECPDS